jgi:hypothetical protein
MPNEKDVLEQPAFIHVPSASGGGAVIRRSQIAGARANNSDESIIYLEAGPSVYSTLSIPQLARFLNAEQVQARRE